MMQMTKITNADRREVAVFMCFLADALISYNPKMQHIASHLLTNHSAVSLFS